MFHTRTLKIKINHLHERALGIAYSDLKSSLYKFFQKYNSFTIHHRSIQSLSIEIYKFLSGSSPSIISNVFKQNQSIPYKLRNCNAFRRRRPNSVNYGKQTISYLDPKFLSIAPVTIKSSKFLESLNLR